jgi:hypothetical protein
LPTGIAIPLRRCNIARLVIFAHEKETKEVAKNAIIRTGDG